MGSRKQSTWLYIVKTPKVSWEENLYLSALCSVSTTHMCYIYTKPTLSLWVHYTYIVERLSLIVPYRYISLKYSKVLRAT